LEGLPERVRNKIIRKQEIKVARVETMNFQKMSKAVLDLHESEVSIRAFDQNVKRVEELSELVDHYETKPAIPRAQKYAPPVAAPCSKRRYDVDELTEAMTRQVRRGRRRTGTRRVPTQQPQGPDPLRKL
jgi:hypothetical protein